VAGAGGSGNNRSRQNPVIDQERETRELARARDAAYRHLSYRSRSRSEVAQKLKEKGFSATVIESVMENLERLGYVNDREFALEWSRSRVRLRGFGKRRIEQELRDRGVSRDLIHEALSEVFDDSSEFELALAEAEKKMRTLSRFEPDVQRRRLAGLLERKGFPAGIIRTVVNKVAPRS
jgi:regulatory protein